MLKQLIQLADKLDKHGFKKEANTIDTCIKIFSSAEDDEALDDIEKLMRGWETEKDPTFPELRNNSPLRPSLFSIDKADIWYTYDRHDNYDQGTTFPDTIETMIKLDGLDGGRNMNALIAFPEGVDILLELENGHHVMSSQAHDENGKDPGYYSEIISGAEINGNTIRKYGLLITNKQFDAYAQEHGFRKSYRF